MLAQHLSIGILMAKIDFWRQHYEISFQFWRENNVHIMRDLVDIHSSGGHDSIEKVLQHTIEWCEKANPSIKYPTGLEITNPYAGT